MLDLHVKKWNSLYKIITNLFVQTISIYDPLQFFFLLLLRFANSHDLPTHTHLHSSCFSHNFPQSFFNFQLFIYAFLLKIPSLSFSLFIFISNFPIYNFHSLHLFFFIHLLLSFFGFSFHSFYFTLLLLFVHHIIQQYNFLSLLVLVRLVVELLENLFQFLYPLQ